MIKKNLVRKGDLIEEIGRYITYISGLLLKGTYGELTNEEMLYIQNLAETAKKYQKNGEGK